MRILAAIGILGIVAAIAATVVTFGGFYNVAATQADSQPVAWALVRVRDASIERRASGLVAPLDLDDPAVVRAGARAFAARGCATCHGAPGVEWAKFSEALNPDPPDLKKVGQGDPPGRIFWVVKNGIRMTAMPAFAAIGADDAEIWSIAAFVKMLPKVTQEDYRAWTANGG